MSTILPTSTSTATATQANSNASTASQISSDFETFLKMLTVQMQNQDPLNPIESSDYAVQLATFSGVEQQVQTNDLLSALSTQLGVSGLSEVSGWIGKDARSAAPVQFDGTPISLTVTPDGNADSARLVVKDANSKVVQTLDIATSATDLQWDGLQSNGATLVEGVYAFEVQNFVDGEMASTAPVEAYGRIVEARVDGGDVQLVLEGGSLVASGQISALRDPLN